MSRQPRGLSALLLFLGLLSPGAPPCLAQPPQPDFLASLVPPENSLGDDYAAVAVSPDGRLLAAGSSTAALRLWDLTSGQLLHELKEVGDDVRGLAFTPDGKTLFADLGRGQFLQVHVATGTPVRDAESIRWNNGLAFSRDGKWLAAGRDDHEVHLLEVDRLPAHRVFSGHSAFVSGVAFAPQARLLASGANNGELLLWDLDTNKLRRRCIGHRDRVTTLAFAPDGRTLASGSLDATLRLWDPETGRERQCLTGHQYDIRCVAFAPDGRSLASASSDGTVRHWDLATGKELRVWRLDSTGALAVIFTPKSQEIVTVDGRFAVRRWDVASGRELACYSQPRRRGIPFVHDVAFSPDGRLVACGYYDGALRLFDTTSGREVRLLGKHPDTIWSVVFSPDGKTVASSARRHGAVRIWDVATGRQVANLHGHRGGISKVIFSRDGKTLVAAGGSFEPHLVAWDIATGRQTAVLRGHTDYVDAVALSWDGKTLVSAARDSSLRAWDLPSGKESRCVHGEEGQARFLAFLNEDITVIVDGSPHGRRLWDLRSGRLLPLPQADWAPALAHSADRRTWVANLGKEGVALWELTTGKRRIFLPGITAECSDLSPDGRRLAVGKADRVRILDLTRGARPTTTTEEREAVWRDLASEDAERAYLALWRLTATPKETTTWLGDKLRPAAPVRVENLAQHLTRLDDDDFTVREAATRTLEQAGEGARSILENALASPPTAEVRRRVESLLTRLDSLTPSPEDVRALRAVEVLESCNTPESRRVLSRLATGDPRARLSREAKQALRRCGAKS